MPVPCVVRRTTSVLIVDDEKNMRTTLADILDEEGYEVVTAATGEEAIEFCTRRGFDVVLLDVRMPGIDGVETFRRIRRHRDNIRVIMMSAFSVDELKQAALYEGAIAFLSKPLDVQQVVKLVGEVKDTAILVVEEDEETSSKLYDALRGQGYRVTLTARPHDALDLVEQIQFDLIFIEAKLPAMNGLELYLAIRKVTPSAVAIMITGMEEEFEEIAQEVVRRTAYTVVKKPLDMDQILAMLERITGKRVSGDLRKPSVEAT
ncbi:MAG: response regulator [Phycisphaerales bacterium]|nr:MAG: response regulator [Phycisphaerales bacterium]